MQNFPAEHYGLIMYDHGYYNDFGTDDTDGDQLIIQEIRQAIENSSLDRIDVLMARACHMAFAETVFELSEVVDVHVASEQYGRTGDWYNSWSGDTDNDWLSTLADQPGTTAVGLAAEMVRGSTGPTYSAVVTSQLRPIATSLTEFCEVALSPGTTTEDWAALRSAQGDVQRYGSSFLGDLGDFMDLVIAGATSEVLRGAAQQVRAAVNDAVIAEDGNIARASGLGVVLPQVGDSAPTDYSTQDLAFLDDENVPLWDDFITSPMWDDGGVMV